MLTTRRALIGAYQMVVQRIGHAYAHSLQPERLRDVATNVLAIALPRHGFDQDGLHPVGGSAGVLPVARRATPKLRVATSLPWRAMAMAVPGYQPAVMCASIRA